jgi:hypothetical protein
MTASVAALASLAPLPTPSVTASAAEGICHLLFFYDGFRRCARFARAPSNPFSDASAAEGIAICSSSMTASAAALASLAFFLPPL